MTKPERLKRDPDRAYVFKSAFKVFLIRCVDAVGKLFFDSAAPPVPWPDIKRVAVLRLDHLGDVLLALPAVRALEQALPNAQVDFIIGPWAKDVMKIAGLRSAPKIFAASWFSRGESRGETVKALAGLLREGNYDAVIELRGDFRHILAIYRAGVKNRIGLSRTGLGFLFTHPLVYQPGQHEMKRNLDVLRQAGISIPDPQEWPRLYPREEDGRIQKEACQKMGVAKPVIAVHAVCSALSKRWSVSNWRHLIENLPAEMDVVMIGTEAERAGMEEIQKGCQREVFIAAGLLSLPVLAAFLKECRLLIGVDSGPSHIAATVGTPVVSLYSGTNLVEQWGPQGPRVTVIQKKTPCSPCELTLCPLGNECMALIKPDEVLEKVWLALQ